MNRDLFIEKASEHSPFALQSFKPSMVQNETKPKQIHQIGSVDRHRATEGSKHTQQLQKHTTTATTQRIIPLPHHIQKRTGSQLTGTAPTPSKLGFCRRSAQLRRP